MDKEFEGFSDMIEQMVTSWNCYTVSWESYPNTFEHTIDKIATVRNAEGDVVGTFKYISGGY